jgi:hypothetical protein
VFALSTPPAVWTSLFPGCSELVVHDCYSDPLGWNGEGPLSSGTITLDTLDAGTVKKCVEGKGREEKCVAVVFDSLSCLLTHRPLGEVYQLAVQSSMEYLVLSLVHCDLHESRVLLSLEHLSSTVLTLSSVQIGDFDGQAQVRHVRKSGKVLKNNEYFKICEDFSLIAEGILPKSTHVIEEPAPDPTANLTFNLSLTDKEKEDRSKTSLPYVKSEEQKVQLLTKGSGKIFYTPDEADDFDDSDPDDDLDI